MIIFYHSSAGFVLRFVRHLMQGLGKHVGVWEEGGGGESNIQLRLLKWAVSCNAVST